MFWLKDKSDYITPVLEIPLWLPASSRVPKSLHQPTSEGQASSLSDCLLFSSFSLLLSLLASGLLSECSPPGLYSCCFLCLGCCPQTLHGGHFLPWSSLLQRHLLSETSLAILFQVAAPLLSFFIFLRSLYPQLIFYTCHWINFLCIPLLNGSSVRADFCLFMGLSKHVEQWLAQVGFSVSNEQMNDSITFRVILKQTDINLFHVS